MWCSLGCDTQQHTTQSTASTFTLPTLQDGRLVFKSKEDFATISRLVVEGKLDFVKSLPANYTSLNSAFKTEAPSKETKELYTVPMDNFAQYFLNPSGEVQIGNSIFKVTPHKVYEVKTSDAWVLNSVETQLANKTSLFISIKDVYSEQKVLATSSCIDFNSNPPVPQRIIGEMWNSWWGFYASIGARTEYQQKDRTFLWRERWDIAPQYILQSLSVNYTYIDAMGFLVSAKVDKADYSNTGRIETVFYADAFVGSPYGLSGTITHIAPNAKRYLSCSTSQ